MNVQYQSDDVVNRSVAVELAKACDLDLVLLSSGQPPRDEEPLICDWDSIPDEHRRMIKFQLMRPAAQPRFVHSYEVDDEQIESLHRNGVPVHRRLDRNFFERLRRAAAA